MNQRLLILLPTPAVPADPATDWWYVQDGAIVDRGQGTRWRELAHMSSATEIVALAPAAAVRIDRLQGLISPDRQQLGVARSQAVMASMADPATLHSVSGLVDDGVAVAVVANGIMLDWMDWLTGQGIDPIAVIPSGLLIPPGADWSVASLGSERLLSRGELVLPDEPALRDIFTHGESIATLSAELIDQRLVFLTQSLPLNLRVGRFARRRLFVLDWGRIRDLAGLALLVPLIGLAMAMAMIVRLESDSDRLDADVAALASQASGQEVTAATASSAIDAALNRTPGASGSPFIVMAAVFQQLQQVPGSGIRQLGWRPDGTLDVTLAATRTEDLNRLLAQLQRQGYLVTAATRPDDSGQAVADVTVRTSA